MWCIKVLLMQSFHFTLSLVQRSIMFFLFAKQMIFFIFLFIKCSHFIYLCSTWGAQILKLHITSSSKDALPVLFCWRGLCNPSFLAVIVALLGDAEERLAPDWRPRKQWWVTSQLQRAVPPVTSTRTLQFPIEESFQGVLTGVADRVMKDKFHNAKGRGADNEIRELTLDPSQHFLFSPSPSLSLS